MKRALQWLATALILALPASGCTAQPSWWPTTPKQDLLAARKAYDAAGRAIVLYRTAGAFTESQGKVIDDTADAAMEMLARWEAAIELGQPTSSVIREWNQILLELVTRQMQGRQWYDTHGKGASP